MSFETKFWVLYSKGVAMRKIIVVLVYLFISSNVQAQNLIDNENYHTKPDGKYSVSYHDFFWINGEKKTDQNTDKIYYSCPNNSDPFYTGQNKNDFSSENQTDFCREVVVRIYYPIQKDDLQIGEFYVPNRLNLGDAINSLPNDQYPVEMKQKLVNELSVLNSFAVADKNIIKNKLFPVLFFNPGLGQNAEYYENFITHLVSHGYIVVGINSVFISGCTSLDLKNTQIIQKNPSIESTPENFLKARGILLKDNEFVYQKIKKLVKNNLSNINESKIFSSMNLEKMGAFGHSIGQLAVADTVFAHPSWFQAAATLELGSDTLSNRPTRGIYPIPVLHQEASLTRYICGHSPELCDNDPHTFNLRSDGFLVIHQIDDSAANMAYSDHINFSDFSTLQYQNSFNVYVKYANNQIIPNYPLNSFLGTANGWKLTDNIDKYLLKFFDSYLKNEDNLPFGDCSHSLTRNSKLICGPASGV